MTQSMNSKNSKEKGLKSLLSAIGLMGSGGGGGIPAVAPPSCFSALFRSRTGRGGGTGSYTGLGSCTGSSSRVTSLLGVAPLKVETGAGWGFSAATAAAAGTGVDGVSPYGKRRVDLLDNLLLARRTSPTVADLNSCNSQTKTNNQNSYSSVTQRNSK